MNIKKCSYFVYVLRLIDGKQYVGITNNPAERIKQHLNTNWFPRLRNGRPNRAIKVETIEKFSNEEEALSREKEIALMIKQKYFRRHPYSLYRLIVEKGGELDEIS